MFKLDNNIKGRCLIAKEDIPAKTKILQDKAIFYAIDSNPYGTLNWKLVENILSRDENNIYNPNYIIEKYHKNILDWTWDNRDQQDLVYLQDKFPNFKNIICDLYWIMVTNSIAYFAGNNKAGFGFFSTLSYINHSCDPNCILLTIDQFKAKMVLVSKRNIKIGEELTIAYIDLNSENYKDKLMKEYGIICKCDKCVQ